MNKIKILVDAHTFDYSFQGSATFIKGLYNGLVEHDNVEITMCAQNLANLKENFPDSRFRFIKLESSSRFKRLVFEWPRIIKSGGFDFAHFQYIIPFFNRCKYVTSLHDLIFLEQKEYFPWSYRFIRRILFNYAAIRSKIVLTISNYSKQSIISKFHISERKVYMMPIGVINEAIEEDIDIKAKYGINKYILYISRFEPRKNQIGLLEVYKQLDLKSQGYELVFIGAKKEAIELDAYLNVKKNIPNDLEDNVKFFENIPYRELQFFLREAECFVFPSFAEGFGIPPIEAAVNKCKVMCSNLTAMADFTFFKYHFDPNDNCSFKENLQKILSDDNYPFEFIKDEAQKRYDWANIANEYLSILSKNL